MTDKAPEDPVESINAIFRLFAYGPTKQSLADVDLLIAKQEDASSAQAKALNALLASAAASTDDNLVLPTKYEEACLAPVLLKAIAARVIGDHRTEFKHAWRFLSYTAFGTQQHQVGLAFVAEAAMSCGETKLAASIAQCALDHFDSVTVLCQVEDFLASCDVAGNETGRRDIGVSTLPIDAAAKGVIVDPSPIWVEILERAISGTSGVAGFERNIARSALVEYYEKIGEPATVARVRAVPIAPYLPLPTQVKPNTERPI